MSDIPRPWRSAALVLVFSGASLATADEGMWLFNDLPREYLKETYDFEPPEGWADHLRLASVRFNSGGSASFVSSSGLVLTNHHVGADTLQKLSTAERNIYRDGFYAARREDEIRTPDLELNQLISIEDVTDEVNAGVPAGAPAAEASAARRAVMAQIEKRSLDQTGLRSDVVTLFGGAQYHLYRYKKYTDVRLVWAPETSVAFFGGDADNFEYPRFCLDLCLFRVYEDDRPAGIEHFLRLAQQPMEEGDLVFVSGNPGHTRRMYTAAAIRYQRDHRLPYTLNLLRRREILFQQYELEGQEQQRQARDELFGIQNARKAYTGMLQGLQDPAFAAWKQAAEQELLAKIAANPKLSHYAEAWQRIEEVQQRNLALLGNAANFASDLYRIAQTLVFLASEDQKSSSERLREFRESNRESLLQQLFSSAPIYPGLEQVKLADAIALFAERRGGDDPLVVQVLAGKSPQERAAQLLAGTRLGDVAERKRLVSGGPAAIEASEDALIGLARLLEEHTRGIRQQEEEIAEIERQAYAQIADATVAVNGTGGYPDATFTLRLAFGTVQGYEQRGQSIPAWTTLEGAFLHETAHGAREPWQLPKRWHQQRERLDGGTPLNFVCTADIIGGNSGSPVVNRQGELVGVIFDGNIQSLTADYQYSEDQARAVAVHIAALLETLPKIYQAPALAEELGK